MEAKLYFWRTICTSRNAPRAPRHASTRRRIGVYEKNALIIKKLPKQFQTIFGENQCRNKHPNQLFPLTPHPAWQHNAARVVCCASSLRRKKRPRRTHRRDFGPTLGRIPAGSAAGGEKLGARAVLSRRADSVGLPRSTTKTLKQKTQKWIEWMLSSQRADGFFGPRRQSRLVAAAMVALKVLTQISRGGREICAR